MMFGEKNKPNSVKKRTNNFIVFLLAFVVFLIVFGGICLWAVIKINQEKRADMPSPSMGSTQTFQFDNTHAKTFLLITVDNNTAQGLVAVRLDPAKTRVRALAIPRDTTVDYKTSEVRLFELYDTQGASAVMNSLGSLIGIDFDNYLAVTYENIGRLIQHFEAGLILTLDENLEYSDDNLTINISGGLRTLSASEVVDVLRYPVWRGGRKQRSTVQAQITAALVNQYMKESRLNASDNDFTFIVNSALKTDILISHYKDAQEGISYLAKNNSGDVCTVLTLPGEYNGSGDAIRYYAPDNIKDTLKTSFE